MKLILDYDDFCSQEPENCLDVLHEMIKEVPHIKFNLFTVPAMGGHHTDYIWLKEVRKLVESNNVRLCVHGLYHDHLEFENIDSAMCKAYLNLIDNHVNSDKKSWLPVFKGPNWGINSITIEHLISHNYTHIYNHEDHKYLEPLHSDQIKFVYYNQNLKDNIIPQDFMIAHGHTHNVCGNGIRETKNKVLRFIDQYKPEFLWANEV